MSYSMFETRPLEIIVPILLVFVLVTSISGCRERPNVADEQATTENTPEAPHVEAVELAPPAGLVVRLPDSVHGLEANEGLAIYVGRTGIAVGDELVVSLQDGFVAVGDRASESSLLVPAIETAIRANGATGVTLYADQSIPYETIAAVYLSCVQAELAGIEIGVRGQMSTLFAYPIDAPEIRGSLGRILDDTNPLDEGLVETSTILGAMDEAERGDEGTMGAPDEGAALGPDSSNPPVVHVVITHDGFIVTDIGESAAFADSDLGEPIDGCPSEGAESEPVMTVCIPPTMAEAEKLSERLDYRGLYNRLIEIRDHPALAGSWGDGGPRIVFSGTRRIALGLLIQTMELAAVRRELDHYELPYRVHDAQCHRQGEECESLFRAVSLGFPASL